MAPYSDPELPQSDAGQQGKRAPLAEGGGFQRVLPRPSVLLAPPLLRLADLPVLQGVPPHLLGEGIPRRDGYKSNMTERELKVKLLCTRAPQTDSKQLDKHQTRFVLNHQKNYAQIWSQSQIFCHSDCTADGQVTCKVNKDVVPQKVCHRSVDTAIFQASFVSRVCWPKTHRSNLSAIIIKLMWQVLGGESSSVV